MNKNRPNKIPGKKTLARHFAQGKLCDYPAEAIFSAINAYDYEYNPIAIPIELGFEQIFIYNLEAFAYLCKHRTTEVLSAFIANPNSHMQKVGVNLPVPFDEITPKIMAAMLEDEYYEALMSDDRLAVFRLTVLEAPNSWTTRHPERYPASFMKRPELSDLMDYPILTEKYLAGLGLPFSIRIILMDVIGYFTE